MEKDWIELKTEPHKKYLNLGCGLNIREGWTNVDIQKSKGIDFSFDIAQLPYPFEDNTFDYILLDNVFEHLLYPEKILPELLRIATKGATVRIIVPYYNSKAAYNDVTHYHFFNKRTFENIFDVNTSYKHGTQNKFQIKSINLLPTRLGKLIPWFIRESFSYYIGNIYRLIDVEVVAAK